MERITSVTIVVTINTTKHSSVDEYELDENETVEHLFERAEAVAETRLNSVL